MKKLLMLILSLSMATVALTSCANLFAPPEESSSTPPASEAPQNSSSVETPAAVTYKVTFKQIGEEDVVVEVKEGEAVPADKIPALKEKTGYTVAWPQVDLSNVTADVVVEAVVTANTYTITFVAGEGVTYPATKSVVYDSDVALSAPEREGFEFLGWADADGNIVNSGKWTIASDITLTAQWREKAPELVTVTFVYAENNTVVKTVEKGSALTDIPAFPTAEGYDYSWDVTDFSAINENITVNLIAVAKEYTITYNANGGAITAGNETQKVTYGQAYELAYPTVERADYNLIGWNMEEGSLPTGNWNIAGDVTLYAQWKEVEKVTVTFKTQAGEVLATSTIVKGATLAEVPALPEKAGYTYVWDKATDVAFNENTVITAIATANKYKITFVAGEGATVEGATTQEVTFDAAYTLTPPTATKEGYALSAWALEEGTLPVGAWTIASDVTVYAQWVEVLPDMVTITFVYAEGNTVVKTVEKGSALTDIPAFPTAEGYDYSWDVTDFSAINENITVNLIAVAKEYTITYNANGGAITAGNETQKVTYGQAYELAYPTVERADYNLIGWNMEEGSLPTGNWNIAGDVTLYAQWKEVEKVTVTFKTQAGEVLATSTIVKGATLAEVPALPEKAGYTYVWDKATDVAFNENTVITAIATANKYKITFVAGEGATLVGAATQEVTYDAAYTLNNTTATKEGFKFIGWDKELPVGAWTIADNVTLNAVWEEIQYYTVSFVQAGQTIKTYTVEEGKALTDYIAVTPVTGYTVVWNEADLAKLANVTTNLTVNAVITANEYTVTFVDAKGVVTQAVKVTFDAAYDLTPANAPAGYEFGGYTYNGEFFAASNTAWKIDGDVTLTVVWTAKTYTVTLNTNGGEGATSITVTYGEAYELPTPTRTDYIFEGWYQGDTKVENVGVWTLTGASIELTAKWKADDAWTKNY